GKSINHVKAPWVDRSDDERGRKCCWSLGLRGVQGVAWQRQFDSCQREHGGSHQTYRRRTQVPPERVGEIASALPHPYGGAGIRALRVDRGRATVLRAPLGRNFERAIPQSLPAHNNAGSFFRKRGPDFERRPVGWRDLVQVARRSGSAPRACRATNTSG